MQNFYLDLEKEFQEFLQIVPILDNPRTVYSPRLYGLFHHTCTQIESLSKWICDSLSLQPNGDSFYSFYNKINEHDLFSSLNVVLIKTNELVFPFRNQNALSMDGRFRQHSWWVSYNRSKHDYPDGLIHATLGNVIFSLSSAYLLHEVARVIDAINDSSVLESNKWHNKFQHSESIDRVLLHAYKYAYELDSKMFVYRSIYSG